MSSAVAELEAGLQAMLSLKPPGVSGSRIQTLTALCMANVQSESVLIQKLYTHFKKAPGSHKLGVLYVVDSVTRKWTENAKSSGQTINGSADDGTFAAGVYRVTELLPVLMTDITQSAPEDQKEKIRKLVDIWEKGQTFPLQLLNQFKEKLNTPPPKSTTPDGTPPPNAHSSLSMQPQSQQPLAAAAPNTTSILEALANMARQQQNTTAAAAAPSIPAQANSYNLQNAQHNPVQNMPASVPPTFPYPPPQHVNVPAPTATFAPQGLSNVAQNAPSNNQQAPFGVAPALPQAPVDPQLQQQIMIIKTLAENGVPQEQWGGIIAALTASGAPGGTNNGLPQPSSQYPPQNQNQTGWGARPDESRDRTGYNEPLRSPPGRYRRHSRSISPPRTWENRNSPNSRRRDEPSYDDYGRGSPGRGRGEDRSRGRDYRQRSPPSRRDRIASPQQNGQHGEKWVQYDDSIGKGNIKVLSRTLFVGGVTTSDQELRSIFDRFGEVQTCIVNKDKRHAFVKMISRKDAVTAKDAMESNRTPDQQARVRSTRWGVGFGPRDCSDYQTGVSIIPIAKLTDADKKWMLTAEYGGSGGLPIVSGMVVEEPDIEIGQGVSSKAISRRMQTDKGGSNGPKSSREHEEEENGRYRRDRPDRREERRDDDRGLAGMNAGNIPQIPGFPYLPQSMAMFPPGFVFPGQNSQPPPPGQR